MTADDAAVPITNTLFPPPPLYYEAYTDAALKRHAELIPQGLGGASGDQRNGGMDVDEDPDLDLFAERRGELGELEEKLGKPRVDWVEEDGRWMAFGLMYTTKPVIPTAQSIGLPTFFPNPQPQKDLSTLLHSFLHTLLLLLDTLTNTARTPDELAASGWAHEGDQYIQHLTNLAAHMMVASNQLRGVQSEATLELMMEKELEERRQQTATMRNKCREIAATIKALRSARGEGGVPPAL